jgi:hypothetical protein
MSTAAKQTRTNRTITVDFRDEATYVQLLGDGKAFVECVCAFLLSLGFQLAHKATCQGGGYLTRHSHYLRVRLGGVTIWRLQCTRCRAVFTVLPHFVLRYRQMRPEVARDALLATHGGLSLELCAIIWHISPMALSRLVCAFGQHSVVTVLTRCGLPLPPYFIADEKHSRCLTAKVYLPTIVSGRVLWHLGYTEEASAAAFTQSYREFQRADAVPGCTPWRLPAPRAQQAPEETDGDRVASASVAPREVPRPALEGATAQELARGCARSTAPPLCGPRGAQSRSGQWGARPALVSGEEGGLVCRA